MLREDADCRTTVVSFLNEKLHIGIFADDIESAHALRYLEQILLILQIYLLLMHRRLVHSSEDLL